MAIFDHLGIWSIGQNEKRVVANIKMLATFSANTTQSASTTGICSCYVLKVYKNQLLKLFFSLLHIFSFISYMYIYIMQNFAFCIMHCSLF